MIWHGEDDQPAEACWLACVGGALPSCVCSAGTIKTLLTPNDMRSLLASWRDAGTLSTSELHDPLQEVDVACGCWEGAP